MAINTIQNGTIPAINGNGINSKIYPSDHQRQDLKEHLKQIKENLLNPAEVTFCDISKSNDTLNSNKKDRKRLTTISSEASDTDSIGSTSTVHPGSTKKKPNIPDGGYGECFIFFFP